MARRKSRYSGIGGQAVLEGVMMKNKEKYAVAVRKPDGEIEVEVETYQGLAHGSKFKELPFIRGIFNFLDSLILGTRALNYSASFYEEEEGKETKFDKAMDKIRIALFLLYVWGISAMKDIRRLYQYHGAEHKCINCIEKGRPLTVHNVMRSSRLHKRCGTSFIFFVMLVSIVLHFVFVLVPVYWVRLFGRLLMVPVVAGISFEIIQWAGRSDSKLADFFSKPGLAMQKLTTKEPTADMAEVAIRAVEAVFDWKAYLKEEFGVEAEQ